MDRQGISKWLPKFSGKSGASCAEASAEPRGRQRHMETSQGFQPRSFLAEGPEVLPKPEFLVSCDAGQISLNSNTTPVRRGDWSFTSVSISSWLAGPDQPPQQIVNYYVYCSVLGRAGAEETRPSALHPSFRLIRCLVCMTPANEPNTDNRSRFPLRGASGPGRASNAGPEGPDWE